MKINNGDFKNISKNHRIIEDVDQSSGIGINMSDFPPNAYRDNSVDMNNDSSEAISNEVEALKSSL